VAVIEEAHRLTEDAQSALLKTLEEPAPGVVLLLCADEEERLLPTVRSRCARIRLGPVPAREIEAWLVEQGVADAPRAARLARLAGGRPGVGLAYARSAEAETARGEIARRLLDLLQAHPAAALVAARDLLSRSLDLARALEASPPAGRPPARGRGRRGATGPGLAGPGSQPREPSEPGEPGEESPGRPEALVVPAGNGSGAPLGVDRAESPDMTPSPGRLSAPERRRAALVLIRTWQELARDLAFVALGAPRRVRDPALLDELQATVESLPAGRRSHPGSFLARLARSAELIEGNVSPELAIDVLVLAWRLDAGQARSA
jgi:hypothetical protein